MTTSTQSSAFNVVLIGYGNQQHGDDGIGPELVRLVEALNLPGIKAYAVTRLTPELSGKLAEADYAIFVDACKMTSTDQIRMKSLDAVGSETTGSSVPCSGHSCDPRSLLALTHSVYGHHPQAWWLEVPATEFGDGCQTSETAEWGMQSAFQAITALVTQVSPKQLHA